MGVVVAEVVIVVVALEVTVVVGDVVGVVPSQLPKLPSARNDSVNPFIEAASASQFDPPKNHRPKVHPSVPSSASGPLYSPIA